MQGLSGFINDTHNNKKTVTFTCLLLNQCYKRYQVLFSVPDDSFPIQMTAGIPGNFLKSTILVSSFFACGVTLKSLLKDITRGGSISILT